MSGLLYSPISEDPDWAAVCDGKHRRQSKSKSWISRQTVCAFSGCFPLKQKRLFDKNRLQSFWVEGTEWLVTKRKETFDLPGIGNVVRSGNGP